ncbi:hypothetical protein PPACK8108_LOCUS8975, partial [Phakopsora pachyrhizi]
MTSKIPLIKAPGNWLPKMIVPPSDVHPIPDDITAYFVYPYTLEASSLNYLQQLSAHPANMSSRLEKAEAYLEERRFRKERERLRIEEEMIKQKKESLRLVAPGWSGKMDSILMAPSSSSEITGQSEPQLT